MSTWNCLFPSTPTQPSTFEDEKPAGFWLLQHLPLLPLSRRSSRGWAGSEPAPALGLPVHGHLALLQHLLQLCQLAAAHFQPLPGRQERKVSRTQHNNNLYKYSLNFQGRFHQTQAVQKQWLLGLQLQNLRISHELPTTGNPQLPQAELLFPSRAGKVNNWQETSTFWRDLWYWKVQFTPSFTHWHSALTTQNKDLDIPP